MYNHIYFISTRLEVDGWGGGLVEKNTSSLYADTAQRERLDLKILPTLSVARTDWLVCETAPSGGFWRKQINLAKAQINCSVHVQSVLEGKRRYFYRILSHVSIV